MQLTSRSRWALVFGTLAVLEWCGHGWTQAQEKDLQPSDEPAFGSVALKEGFQPAPFKKNLVAGGKLQRKVGAVTSWLDPKPDFVLDYTPADPAKVPLVIYFKSNADTTLVIKLPDGTWVADDDSGGNFDPLLQFERPQAGRYVIWVGTYSKETAYGVLFIAPSRPTSARAIGQAPENKLLFTVSTKQLDALLTDWKISHERNAKWLQWKDGDDVVMVTTLLRDRVILISSTLPINATLEQVNKWNDERVTSRAVLKDGRPRLESDLNCALGVTLEGIHGFIDDFNQSLRSFRDFLSKEGMKEAKDTR